MLRSEKKEFVNKLENLYNNCSLVIVTHYHGINVAQMTNLRKSLREKGASFKVVKNTLSKLALSNAGNSESSKLYSGPTAIVYSENSFEAAKIVVDFAKSNERLKIIGGVANDQVLDATGINQLATLPSLDELRGKIVGVLQAPAAQLARLFKAYADKN